MSSKTSPILCMVAAAATAFSLLTAPVAPAFAAQTRTFKPKEVPPPALKRKKPNSSPQMQKRMRDPFLRTMKRQLLSFPRTLAKYGLELKYLSEAKKDVTRIPVGLSVYGFKQFFDTRKTYFENIGISVALPKRAKLDFAGKFEVKPDEKNPVVSGTVTISIVGKGGSMSFKYDHKRGLVLTAGAKYDRQFIAAGVTVDTTGKYGAKIVLKAGGLQLHIDPVKYVVRSYRTYRQIAAGAIKKVGAIKQPKVGGVFLGVNPQLLYAASTNTLPAYLKAHGSVWLVSLKRLLPLAKARKIRTLAPVTRIEGFIVDKKAGDVLLIGRSEAWAPPIEVDVLIAVLRAVWRHGMSPYVSLDPQQPHKWTMLPSIARIGGVPDDLRNSRMIQIMLRADAKLKSRYSGSALQWKDRYEVAFCRRFLGSDQAFRVWYLKNRGYRISRQTSRGRLWLSPRPPAIGDIRRFASEEGSLFHFRTGVVIRREIWSPKLARFEAKEGHRVDMSRVRQMIEKRKSLLAENVQALTANYHRLERRYRDFKSLRQIVELMMFARLARRHPVPTEMMSALAQLPVRTVRVRKQWPRYQWKSRCGRKRWIWRGGAVMRMWLSQAKFLVKRSNAMQGVLGKIRQANWRRRPVVFVASLFTPSGFVEPGKGNIAAAENLLDRSRQALDDRKFKAAFDLASRAARIAPKVAEIHAVMAVLANKLRNYSVARNEAAIAIKGGLESAFLFGLRGYALLSQKKYKAALVSYNQALRLNPRDAVTYNNRGNAYDGLGHYRRAIADYDQAIRLNPRYAGAYFNRGLTYRNLKQYRRSIADYDQAIRVNPSNAKYYYVRGKSHYSYVGYSYYKFPLRQYRKAVADFTKAIELNPRLSRAYEKRANIYDFHLKQPSKAISDYSKAIELDSSLISAHSILKFKHKLFPKAIAFYNQLVELKPQNASAYEGRGWLYYYLGQHQKAIADFTKAIELTPTQPHPKKAKAYYTRGVTISKFRIKQELYHGKSNRTRKLNARAIADFTIAIKLNPRLAYAYYRRGLGYLEFRQYRRALADFTSAIKLKARYNVAIAQRGFAFEMLGNRRRAIQDYRAACAIERLRSRGCWMESAAGLKRLGVDYK